jgi:hypothetical protein
VQFTEKNMHQLHATTCGQKAWAEMLSHNQDAPYDEQDSYDDVFFNAINNSDGACVHCKTAHKLKFTKLSLVNKEFGVAKRVISQLGKGLFNG